MAISRRVTVPLHSHANLLVLQVRTANHKLDRSGFAADFRWHSEPAIRLGAALDRREAFLGQPEAPQREPSVDNTIG